LEWDVWTKFADDLKEKKIEFVIEPYIRFKGEVGEQATLFFLDPENNALEFKAFKDINQLFSK
jgi:extradiol dioxygenase family protein